jgi:hypothetical protein
VDGLECPRCGGRMRILAAIEDPSVARKILATSHAIKLNWIKGTNAGVEA